MQMILLFPNVREVMKADRILKDNGLKVQVMPVPERISSECGMCMSVAPELVSDAIRMLQVKGAFKRT